jgi:hypothetical protein
MTIGRLAHMQNKRIVVYIIYTYEPIRVRQIECESYFGVGQLRVPLQCRRRRRSFVHENVQCAVVQGVDQEKSRHEREALRAVVPSLAVLEDKADHVHASVVANRAFAYTRPCSGKYILVIKKDVSETFLLNLKISLNFLNEKKCFSNDFYFIIFKIKKNVKKYKKLEKSF